MFLEESFENIGCILERVDSVGAGFAYRLDLDWIIKSVRAYFFWPNTDARFLAARGTERLVHFVPI